MDDRSKLIEYYNILIKGYIDEVKDLRKLIKFEENFGTGSEKDGALERLYKRLFECETLINCFKNNIELLVNEENIRHCINILNNSYDRIKKMDNYDNIKRMNSYGFMDNKSR